MEKFLIQFLGSTDVPTYLAAFAYALIGALIGVWYDLKTRDKGSKQTPYTFKLSFFIKDTMPQLFVGFLITFVAFRFADELFGIKLTMFKSLIIGLSTNKIAELLCKAKLKARRL